MKDDPMNRLRVKRGSDLPHAKLTEANVREIAELIERRAQLQAQLRTLTNAAIAQRYGVHVRTIDRVTAGETWGHVA